MRDQLIQIAARGIARLDHLARSAAQQQVGVIRHVEIALVLVGIVTREALLAQQRLDVIIVSDLRRLFLLGFGRCRVRQDKPDEQGRENEYPIQGDVRFHLYMLQTNHSLQKSSPRARTTHCLPTAIILDPI